MRLKTAQKTSRGVSIGLAVAVGLVVLYQHREIRRLDRQQQRLLSAAEAHVKVTLAQGQVLHDVCKRHV